MPEFADTRLQLDTELSLIEHPPHPLRKQPRPIPNPSAEAQRAAQRVQDNFNQHHRHAAELRIAREKGFEKGARQGFSEGWWWGLMFGVLLGGAGMYVALHMGLRAGGLA